MSASPRDTRAGRYARPAAGGSASSPVAVSPDAAGVGELARLFAAVDRLAVDVAAARRDLKAVAEALVRLAQQQRPARRDPLDPAAWTLGGPAPDADSGARMSRLELD